MWSMNGMIHTCTYHVDYKTIFCRFLRHVINEWHDTYLYLSCWLEDNLLSVPDMWSMNGMIHTCTYHVDYKTIFCRFLRHVIHEWHDTYLYLSCWLEDNLLSVPDMWSMRYVSCHSWITCQESTEDCLIVNMISTCMYHAIHGSHVRNRQKIVF
jgi:hypothetical protein